MLPTQFSSFQARISSWAHSCFGSEVATNRQERAYRFFEEAIELVQSLEINKGDCLKLIDYVYSRKTGELEQEIGGVVTTLAVLCEANKVDMISCAENEIERCWINFDKIRRKQLARPHHSPLPGTLESFQKQVRESGMSDDELQTLFEEAREEKNQKGNNE